MKALSVFSSIALLALATTLPAAAPVTVTQKGLQFSSSELTVSKGQVVVFVNDDRTSHNITVKGDGVSLNGGLQQPGGQFSVPFTKSGTYEVSCGIHPKMKLEVTVK
jgi:plastocyanin